MVQLQDSEEGAEVTELAPRTLAGPEACRSVRVMKAGETAPCSWWRQPHLMGQVCIQNASLLITEAREEIFLMAFFEKAVPQTRLELRKW